MFNRKKRSENYLEQVPRRNPDFAWKEDEKGFVTVDMIHRGLFDKLAQTLFVTPKVSHIHLDAFGSFVWKQIDGERDLVEIGRLVKEEFGDKAEPLYERLAKFVDTLENSHFRSYETYGAAGR